MKYWLHIELPDSKSVLLNFVSVYTDLTHLTWLTNHDKSTDRQVYQLTDELVSNGNILLTLHQEPQVFRLRLSDMLRWGYRVTILAESTET